MILRPISPHRPLIAAVVLAFVSAACGGDDSGQSSPTADAGTRADASIALDAAAAAAIDAATKDAASADTGTGAAVIPTFNGCTPEKYLDKSGASDSRTVEIAAMGLTFTPKCITIAKGQTVAWTGQLTVHPLAAGNATHPKAGVGTTPSPIVETSTGNTVSFTFPAAGTYPYYCEAHDFGNGEGMAGVIHVE